jgi:hypothetical protein
MRLEPRGNRVLPTLSVKPLNMDDQCTLYPKTPVRPLGSRASPPAPFVRETVSERNGILLPRCRTARKMSHPVTTACRTGITPGENSGGDQYHG